MKKYKVEDEDSNWAICEGKGLRCICDLISKSIVNNHRSYEKVSDPDKLKTTVRFAFDVTPATLISGYITKYGVLKASELPAKLINPAIN